jgi:hypothetical protein
MLLLLSSDTNLPLIESLARQAGFDWTLVARKSILIESFLIFRLTRGANVAAAASRLPGRAELEAAYLRREANQDVAVLEALALAKAVLDSSPERDALRHTLSGIEAQLDARTSPVIRDGYMAQAWNRLEQVKAAKRG